MNLKDLKTEEIKYYIQAEKEKGRNMREIVEEVAANRDDFIILSHDLETGRKQIIESVKRQQNL